MNMLHVQVGPKAIFRTSKGEEGGAHVHDGGNGHHPRLPKDDILERGNLLVSVIGLREEAFRGSCGPAVGARLVPDEGGHVRRGGDV